MGSERWSKWKGTPATPGRGPVIKLPRCRRRRASRGRGAPRPSQLQRRRVLSALRGCRPSSHTSGTPGRAEDGEEGSRLTQQVGEARVCGQRDVVPTPNSTCWKRHHGGGAPSPGGNQSFSETGRSVPRAPGAFLGLPQRRCAPSSSPNTPTPVRGPQRSPPHPLRLLGAARLLAGCLNYYSRS